MKSALIYERDGLRTFVLVLATGDEPIKALTSFAREQVLGGSHFTAIGAFSRAVVAYCDGKTVHTFTGETSGSLAETPRGDVYKFYWDTVFIPDDENPEHLTYSEIVEQLGLEYKVVRLSQSTKAMLTFLEFRRGARPELWPTLD